MDATALFKSRSSVRKYKPQVIADKIIDDILDCARLAPTARNVQPWLIGAVTDKSLLKKLGSMVETGPFIANAAVCFAVFTQKNEKYYLEDGCAATLSIILACQAHGLGSCWVAGDKKSYIEDARKLLNVPEGYTLVALVPAGYPAEAAAPHPKKPKEEVTFKDRKI
ncbi:Nitroreductase family protein [uncultured archaeon]|nr:Nitroreductase family protein [uncultured archaeon]